MGRVGKIFAVVGTAAVLAAGGCMGVAGDEKPPAVPEADETRIDDLPTDPPDTEEPTDDGAIGGGG